MPDGIVNYELLCGISAEVSVCHLSGPLTNEIFVCDFFIHGWLVWICEKIFILSVA